MTVDLLPIINIEGKSLSVKDTIDFSAENGFDISFTEKAQIEATFTVWGDSINLVCRVHCPVTYVCDRCNTPYGDSLDIEFEETLKKESVFENRDDSDPDIVFFTGNSVEMDSIVYKNIFMNIPTKKLCNPECKGLCGKCGKNLNDGVCECDTRETDPRFDILDNFFK